MLYEIGVILILLSAAFCGGSVLVPVTITALGLMLMVIGRRTDNGKQNGTDK